MVVAKTRNRRTRPIQTVTLTLYRFGPWYERLWAFAQMGLARGRMTRIPGCSFWKLMGSGTGEGFTPVPNTGVYAVLCAWTDQEAARAGLSAPVFKAYARHAVEVCTLHLTPLTSRGRWSGMSPFRPLSGSAAGPLAALTRATVRPRNLLKFWRRVPDISRRIGDNEDVQLKIGVGEVPFLHQVTFSVWPNAEAMARFARTSGPHAAAIQAVRDGNWFAEELYARFSVTDAEGQWEGRTMTEVLA